MAINRVAAIPLGDIDSSTLTGGWDVLYAGLPEACSIFRVINASNVSVQISYDAVTSHEFVPAGGVL